MPNSIDFVPRRQVANLKGNRYCVPRFADSYGDKPSSEFPFVLVMDSWDGKKKLSEWRPLRQVMNMVCKDVVNEQEEKEQVKAMKDEMIESLSNESEDEEARRHLADLALQITREAFDITLDYSVESMRTVDEVLQLAYEESTRTGEKDGLPGIALEFGAYISYVIDKNFSPGKWRPHHPQFGQCSFPFEWNGITLFPTAWCEKQLLNGAEDSVWAKFMVITKRANSSSSSTTDNS